MAKENKLNIEMFKNIERKVDNNCAPGTLHSYIADDLKNIIGNTLQGERLLAKDILNWINVDETLITLPPGIYTNESFSKELIEVLSGKDVRLDDSYLVGVKSTLPMHLNRCYIIDSSLIGGSIFASHIYKSEKGEVDIDNSVIYKTRCPNGGGFSCCHLIESSTTKADLKRGTVIQGGVHSFSCFSNETYIESLSQLRFLNVPNDLKSVVSSSNLDISNKTIVGLSPDTEYIPKYDIYDVELRCSLDGDELLLHGSKGVNAHERVPERNSFRARIINIAIKSKRFSSGNVKVCRLYQHINGKVDLADRDLFDIDQNIQDFDDPKSKKEYREWLLQSDYPIKGMPSWTDTEVRYIKSKSWSDDFVVSLNSCGINTKEYYKAVKFLKDSLSTSFGGQFDMFGKVGVYPQKYEQRMIDILKTVKKIPEIWEDVTNNKYIGVDEDMHQHLDSYDLLK